VAPSVVPEKVPAAPAVLLPVLMILALTVCPPGVPITAIAADTEPPTEITGGWRNLEPGLDLGTFHVAGDAPERRGAIQLLRVDPARFALRLLNASAEEPAKARTAREWCQRHQLVAAINASMYQADFRTSVSLMRTRDHVNNTRLSKDNTVLVFDALDDTVPPVQIIDRQCQDFAALRPHYGSLVQSIRMVSCHGNNVWSPQEKRWSTAAIGVDTAGRVLLIHVREPHSTHDLINLLLELPIDLYNAMYAEGGIEAQLYVDAGGERHEFLGIYETGLDNADDFSLALRIPNVIGVVRREP